MQKHFKSETKLNRKCHEALSDTEIEFRKGSQEILVKNLQDWKEKCEEKLEFSPQKLSSSKGFKLLKIKDEVKIDLRKYESSSSSSRCSRPKIYPIEEVSENVSRASSRMILQQNKKIQELQKVLEENKNKARPLTRSRVSPLKKLSPVRVKSDVQVLKSIGPPDECQSESEFAEEFEETNKMKGNSSYSARLKQFSTSVESFDSFKLEQIRRLSREATQYGHQRQLTSRPTDSHQDLLSIRTYSTTNSNRESCFGCIFKPLAEMCKRKTKKT